MTATFRTPEDVAPEIGLKPKTLRRLCRQTGICTRLERGRITLSAEDVERIIEHIKTRPEPVPDQTDPFA
jgi:predicted site-specific integrase-resolvase